METLTQQSPADGTRCPTVPVLRVKDLHVKYGPVTAVDGVSFDIQAGEVFGLAGESGCGKSTVANAVMRLLQSPAEISSGSIELNGTNILELDDAALRRTRWREVSMVFQSAMNALNPVMSVGEQIVDVFTAHEKTTKKAALAKAGELLDLVGIPRDRLKAYPHQLSGGMRQRAVIATALALRPSLLIMDEPTTALDVVVQQEIMEQIKELQREFGFSILFITHDISLMVELSHRMAVMYAGRLVEVGSASELLESPGHPYSSALMNAFPPLAGPREELKGLPDAPPNMANPPSGCRFHPRCALAIDACRVTDPLLRPIRPDHEAACLLAPGYGDATERPTR